jgi:hypothetical protein
MAPTKRIVFLPEAVKDTLLRSRRVRERNVAQRQPTFDTWQVEAARRLDSWLQ